MEHDTHGHQAVGGAVKDEHYHINNVAGTLRFRNDKRDYHARPDRSPLRPRLRAVRLDGGDHCRDEASEVSQKTVEVLFSRLRWKTHETFKVSKMLLTPNPTTNWIRSRFVQNDNGERATCREGGAASRSPCATIPTSPPGRPTSPR